MQHKLKIKSDNVEDDEGFEFNPKERREQRLTDTEAPPDHDIFLQIV